MPGRIPWSVVMAYADRHGYTTDEAEFLDRCLAVMDGVYHEWWRAQQPPPPPATRSRR
jgi:hypothetical protein